MKIATLFVPLFIAFVVVYGCIKRIKVYEAFIEGAKQGIKMAFSMAPYVIAFVFAVKMFECARGFEMIALAASPLLSYIGMPGEVMPLILTKPFSGSAAFGVLSNILSVSGPDSSAGRISSVLLGSSETLFYTMSVYLSSNGIRKTRYTLPAVFIADVLGIICSVIFCNLLF